MHQSICKLVAAGALALLAVPASAQVDHLLMSEIGIDTVNQNGSYKSSEFVEVFNPTASAVPLSEYFYTDNVAYKGLPASPAGITLVASDQITQFPASTTLESGQVAVICGGAELFLKEFFPSDADPNVGDLAKFNALPGSPLLFEVEETRGDVPNMVNYNTFAGNDSNGPEFANNLSMTNSGEYGILFHWDGSSDLVQDADMVAWGDVASGGNHFVPKTTADTGANGATYLNDAGSHEILSVTPNDEQVIRRLSTTEANEVQTGGNGITNHDESTEQNSISWAAGPVSGATPGLTTLVVVGANKPPKILAAGQVPMNPVPNAAFQIAISAEDEDGTLASGIVHYSTDGGTTFNSAIATVDSATTLTATIPAQTDGTIVNYYVEVTDNNGATSKFPLTAPGDTLSFIVQANPIEAGDLVINEILGNNKGGDAYEFVEIYNATDTELDLTYTRFADNNRTYFAFPANTKIPAHGYLVVTQSPDDLNGAYPNLASTGVQVLSWNTAEVSFGLNNTGDSVVLATVNGLNYMGNTRFVDIVTYEDVPGTAWPKTSPGSTGRTYELINYNLDNSLPESWTAALLPINSSELPGTPGEQNDVFSVSDNDLALSETFPAPSTAFDVNLSVVPYGDATITSVKLYVDPGTGTFGSAINMTLDTGTTYTATLPGYPDNTDVKYYFEIANSDGETSLWPPDGNNRPLVVKISDNPVLRGDVVINEILFNNNGGDAYEYIELYNNTDDAIDLGYFRILTLANIPYTIPAGTTIAADDYLVISQNSFNFFAAYGENPDLEWLDIFNLDNDGDNVQLISPNLYDPSGDSVPTEFVNYGVAPPWPDQSSENGSEATGASIELINPNYEDRGTNGDRWRFTTNVPNDFNPLVMGTPGAKNSTFSGVSDWTLY